MKFICEKSILQDAISTVQKAVTGKSTMPILEGIFIQANDNKLILTGSDKDLSIETTITANVEESGNIVVDSKLFGDIIRKLPNDNIHIYTNDNNTIDIVCRNSSSTLIYMNSGDYPELPEINEDIPILISQKILKNMIKGTLFATAQDETRPILMGVDFEIKDKNLNMVALDGFRLALVSEYTDNDSNINAVIPGKTLSEVSKILSDEDKEINITFTQNQILFRIDETKIISRLLEGEFIKYNSIIPNEYKSKITVKRDQILESIERASLMAKEGNNNLIKFNIEDEIMVITSNSQLGKAREEISIILQGEPIQIAFNSKYLIDVFKIMEEEEVEMEFTTSVSPCIIKNKENKNSTYLVLPVRLLNN